MNYLKQINAFWNWRLLNKISHAEADLYMGILNMFNSFRHPSSLTIPNSTLVNLCGFSDASQLTKVRNKLLQAGLIKYQKGKNGKAGIYALCQIDNTFDNDFDNDCDNTFDNGFDNDCDNIIKRKEKENKNNIPPYNPPRGKAEKKKADKRTVETVLSEVENEQLRNALRSFIEMRRQAKKPLTAHALELNINRLSQMSSNVLEQIKIVEQSVMNCWQGFYELKDKDTLPRQGCMMPTNDLSAIEAQFMHQYM